MNQQQSFLGIALRGLGMGIAEVIPGVSGGTIAFITNIYERLINAIKAFGPDLIGVLRKDGIKGVWSALDGNFLFALISGMAVGVVIGVFGVAYLLENYPPVIWAFFFGLIIASAIYIGRQITTWSWKEIVAFIIATGVAYYITTISPSNGSESLLMVFVAGAIAISALILPGISGSFILLLMGMYTFIVTDTLKGVLKTLAPDKILTMFVFGLGCLTGLMTISRVLSWMFKHQKNLTLATLTGFIIGSLNKIWPWRVPTEWLEVDGIKEKVISEANILPAAYEISVGEPYTVLSLVCLVLGFVLVLGMERFSK